MLQDFESRMNFDQHKKFEVLTNNLFKKWQFSGNFNQTAICVSGSLVAVWWQFGGSLVAVWWQFGGSLVAV